MDRVFRFYNAFILSVCALGILLVGGAILKLAESDPPTVVVVYERPEIDTAVDVASDNIEPEPPEEEEVAAMPTKPPEPEIIDALARLVWGEARGCSTTEQAAVVWCVLNRVDSDLSYFPDNIMAVLTQRNAFSGYSTRNPVTDELCELVIDVLGRWESEKAGAENVGRVLPPDYLYFSGDGKRNHFRQNYANSAQEWDFSMTSPY